MDRETILQEACNCVCGNREEDYGSPEDNFQTIANLWNAYIGWNHLQPIDVAMMMSLLKIARIKTGRYKEDSFIDLAGYAACAGEIGGNNQNGLDRT